MKILLNRFLTCPSLITHSSGITTAHVESIAAAKSFGDQDLTQIHLIQDEVNTHDKDCARQSQSSTQEDGSTQKRHSRTLPEHKCHLDLATENCSSRLAHRLASENYDFMLAKLDFRKSLCFGTNFETKTPIDCPCKKFTVSFPLYSANEDYIHMTHYDIRGEFSKIKHDGSYKIAVEPSI